MNETSKEKTLAVREIAGVLNVSERVVQLSAKKLFPGKVKNGVSSFFDEQEVTKIKMDLQSHHNLEGTFEAVKTDREMLLKMAEVMDWLRFKVSDQEKQVEEMKPKALFFDQVTESPDSIDMGTAAKTIKICIDKKIGRNELFEILRSKQILMMNNTPYQKYIDQEYFRTIIQKYTIPDGTVKINIKTLVLPKGIDYIIKIIGELPEPV